MLEPPIYCAADIYPLHNLLSASDRMSESSLKVANYIVENPKRVASMSIGELAKATGSNKTAVVRVSKLSGYKGYRALRVALIENRGVLRGAELIRLNLPWSGVVGAENLLSRVREVVKTNMEVLQDTVSLLDEETVLRAVDIILCAKHVFLVGFGTSAPVVQDAYQRFLGLQVPSSTCSDAHVLAKIIVNMTPEDLLFCLSHSGTSREIVEALETAQRRKVSTVTLTSAPRSAAAEFSNTVLVSAVRRTPQTNDTVAVRVAQFAVMDIICAIIALRKELELGTQRTITESGNKRIMHRVAKQWG
jgi:DNA-binding MurR/RpiR family transcriptional regulator